MPVLKTLSLTAAVRARAGGWWGCCGGRWCGATSGRGHPRGNPNTWSTRRRPGWPCTWTPRWLQLERWLRLERSAWGTPP